MYVYNHDGTTLSGFPVTTGRANLRSAPALGDIDGDGDIEIIASSQITFDGVYAFHHTGEIVEDFPISLPHQTRSTPCLGDIDNDGDIELAVGSTDGNVYIWDLSGTYDPANIEWGMAEHNLHHTGLYHTSSGPLRCNETWSGTIYISGDVTVPVGKTLTIGPGTKVVFTANSDDQHGGINSGKCELIVYGTLNAIGNSSYPITFMPSTPQSNNWYGIRVMDNAAAQFEQCTIEYGYNGITLYNGADVTVTSKCYIANNACAGISRGSKYEYPTLTISNSDISNNGVYGVYLAKATIYMTDCTVSDNHSYGIQLSYCQGSINNTDVLSLIW